LSIAVIDVPPVANRGSCRPAYQALPIVMRAVGWCYHFRVAYDNNLALRIPDELSTRYASADEMERGALEALALDEFRLGHLTRPN